ncbi:MAG TPA: hypothetical protein VL996_09780 [Methylocella sp.]|nr:hypothetical protein [Methylocella sp.]
MAHRVAWAAVKRSYVKRGTIWRSGKAGTIKLCYFCRIGRKQHIINFIRGPLRNVQCSAYTAGSLEPNDVTRRNVFVPRADDRCNRRAITCQQNSISQSA